MQLCELLPVSVSTPTFGSHPVPLLGNYLNKRRPRNGRAGTALHCLAVGVGDAAVNTKEKHHPEVCMKTMCISISSPLTDVYGHTRQCRTQENEDCDRSDVNAAVSCCIALGCGFFRQRSSTFVAGSNARFTTASPAHTEGRSLSVA